MENAMPLKQIAAHIDALMATDAAERFENLIAGQLLRRDRVGFARKPAVEAAARRNQRAFVCRDRIQHGSDVGLPARRRRGIGCTISGSARSLLTTSSALDAMIAGLRRLFSTPSSSERNIPFPIQAKVQTYIEDRRRIERYRLTPGVSWALALAPLVAISWHDRQLCVSS